MVVVDSDDPGWRVDWRYADGVVLRQQQTGEEVVGRMMWIIMIIVMALVGIAGFLVGFAYGQERKG